MPTLALQRPEPQAAGPLSGLRVVDLSRLVAGNMLSLQLADFGADVIKVEPPGTGDPLRAWREPLPDSAEGFDGWWQVYGRNKRSLALDLRQAESMAWLRRLINTAQVLVESFKPGTLEAMGLAPDTLWATRPQLVVVRVSGWGQRGPYRDLPGFGSLVEGFCGYAHKHRGADGQPMLPNLALADMVAGLTGAFATMAALREVEVRGGQGQVIDLSLLEPMVAVMGADAAQYAASGRVAPPGEKLASPRGVYRCRDGRWVSLSGSTQTMARRVFEAIGEGHRFDEPRFATNAARLAHDGEIDRWLADFVGTMDRDACLTHFRSRGVTVGPVHDPADLLVDPHVVERGVHVRLQADDSAVPVTMHAVTPRLQRTPGSIRRAAPSLGQHNDELLEELGADAASRQRLGCRSAPR